MALRASESVGVPVFKENIAGLSLLKSIGAAQAAAKVAKDKKDAAAVDRAIKTMGKPLKAKNTIDAVRYINPKLEAHNAKYHQYLSDNEKAGTPGLTTEQEIELKAEYNSLVDETTQSNAQYDYLAAEVAKLYADGKDEVFDHTVSQENQDIMIDPEGWLEKNKTSTRYAEVFADYEQAKKDAVAAGSTADGASYLFRATNYDKYKNVKAGLKYDKYVKAMPVGLTDKMTATPSGIYISTKETIGAAFEDVQAQFASSYYNDPKTQEYADAKFDKLTQAQKDAADLIVIKDMPDATAEQKWFANMAATDKMRQLKVVDKAGLKLGESAWSKAYGGYGGKKAAQMAGDVEDIPVWEGDVLTSYKGRNVETLATGDNKGKNIVTVNAVGKDLKTGDYVNLPSSRKMEVTAAYVDPATGEPYATVSEPEFTLTVSGTPVKNENYGKSYKVNYWHVESAVNANFNDVDDQIQALKLEYAKTAPATPLTPKTAITTNWNKYKRK